MDLLQLQLVGRDDALAGRRVHPEVFARLESQDELVNAFGDRTGPDRVHEVGHVERLGFGGDLLDVHVHGHEVSGHDGPVDRIEHGVGFEVAVDLGVDLAVGDDRRRDGDAQFTLAPNGDLRTHFDLGFEGELTFVFAGGDVDIGLTNGVDEGVRDGTGVKVGQGLANRLRSKDRRAADIGDQDVFGNFALAKSLHRDLFGERFGRGVNRLVHLDVVDFDGQHDFVVL